MATTAARLPGAVMLRLRPAARPTPAGDAAAAVPLRAEAAAAGGCARDRERPAACAVAGSAALSVAPAGLPSVTLWAAAAGAVPAVNASQLPAAGQCVLRYF